MRGARMVAASIPDTTLTPMARRLPAPAPVLTARGRVPRMKAMEVMMMGRKRRRAASMADGTMSMPCLCRSAANSTIRMAFLQARPSRVIMATWV